MADININSNGCSNSKSFPKSQPSISWHSSKACTVALVPPMGNCFGDLASITFPPDDQTFWVASPVTTQFITPCAQKETYDITFTNPVPKPKKMVKKAAAKAAPKKAAAK